MAIHGDNHYTDRVVRITELVTTEDPTIDGFVFNGCHIDGPAVIVPQGCEFNTNNLGGPNADAVLWEISQPVVVGAILVRNSHFENCTFRNVGIAGPPDLIAQFRAAATG